MPSKIIYEWTGEYRPAIKGEWYLNVDGEPWVAQTNFENVSFFIRVEASEESEAKNGMG